MYLTASFKFNLHALTAKKNLPHFPKLHEVKDLQMFPQALIPQDITRHKQVAGGLCSCKTSYV